MNLLKKNQGITMIALTVTIIVLFILAGISITEGKKLIKQAKVENLLTDMITIKAKAKGYAEEINSQVWSLSGDEKQNKIIEIYQGEEYKMAFISSIENSSILNQIDEDITNGSYYGITKETLENMGLSSIAEQFDDDTYVVVYNTDDYTKLDIIYLPGILYNDETCYTLSYLQEKFEE